MGLNVSVSPEFHLEHESFKKQLDKVKTGLEGERDIYL